MTSTRKHQPWYSDYNALRDEVASLKDIVSKRCDDLGQAANSIILAFRRDLVARTVRESNWQEGIELDLGRTQQLAEVDFQDLRFPGNNRLDLNALASSHRDDVLAMKRTGHSPNEIATVSLARAHKLLEWIGHELCTRQVASILQVLDNLANQRDSFAARDDHLRRHLDNAEKLVQKVLEDGSPIYGPLLQGASTTGELLHSLLSSPFNDLLSPMDARYIHALHQITMMGTLPPGMIGRWRDGMVHVGNPDLLFPPPESVDSLMSEFVREFPFTVPNLIKYDPIRMAAEVSYRFVRIHPYSDGNGRISRLLMNLVLFGHHPTVSLAPRAKERHRYRQAIRRADRGNLDPLACLIAISLRDTYRRILDALGAGVND